jgi:hypothetical protein
MQKEMIIRDAGTGWRRAARKLLGQFTNTLVLMQVQMNILLAHFDAQT